MEIASKSYQTQETKMKIVGTSKELRNYDRFNKKS